MNKNWRIFEQVAVPTELREAVGGHPLVARLLAQRNFEDVKTAQAYLDPDRYTPASPYELEGLGTAKELLCQAIRSGKRIRIWGDFDADGQTATVVLYEALKAMGATVDYQLPKRFEGHGLHARVLEEALSDSVSTLITCDTGITDADLVERGIAAGLTLIVTDHHDLPSRLPPAQAIVNPKQLPPKHPLYEISGVGVTYMLARALLEQSSKAVLLEDLLALVALGLVADLSRQVNDVRYLIQRGLGALHNTRRAGLQALFEIAALDQAHLDEQDVGFQLAPRLNAAGRLGDPEEAVRLLLTSQEIEARALANKLEALNRDRQARTEALLSQVEEHLQRSPDLLHEPAIVLDGEDWEGGILGLVAGKLTREYGRPTILITHRKGRSSVGSARSVEGINIHEAIASQSEHLLSEGGHPMAAGFSIARRDVADFQRNLLDWLRRQIPPERVTPEVTIDAELPWGEIGLEIARQVSRLAPFGEGNPAPIFMASRGTLVRTADVSQRRATPHRRLYLDDVEGRSLQFVWFNAKELPQRGESIDIAFHIALRHWKGREQLQLEVVDWRPAVLKTTTVPPSIVGGREIVDWRHENDWRELLGRLRTTHGESLCVWVEGILGVAENAATRVEIPKRSLVTLAILTPPPSPEALQYVLRRANPQIIYLLPPYNVPTSTPSSFLKKVAGMLRVALRSHGGKVDILRMAARIGARQAAILAALRGLEASGKIRLCNKDGEVYAELQKEGAAPIDSINGDLQQARDTLIYLLNETRAYREAYRTQSLEELFHASEPPPSS